MDLAGVLEAKDVVQIDASGRAMDVGKSLGMSEASVVVIDEERLEETIGLIDGRDVLFAQVFDEAILMGSIGSFDTAFGLGGMSIDTSKVIPAHRTIISCSRILLVRHEQFIIEPFSIACVIICVIPQCQIGSTGVSLAHC